MYSILAFSSDSLHTHTHSSPFFILFFLLDCTFRAIGEEPKDVNPELASKHPPYPLPPTNTTTPPSSFRDRQLCSHEEHTKFEHLFHHVVFVEKLKIELI